MYIFLFPGGSYSKSSSPGGRERPLVALYQSNFATYLIDITIIADYIFAAI